MRNVFEVIVCWAFPAHPLFPPYLTSVNDADIALSEHFDALGFDTSFRSWESDDEQSYRMDMMEL